MRGVTSGEPTSAPPPTTAARRPVVESIEIDLVSDEDDDDGAEIKISATIFRVPPPPLQDHTQQQQSNGASKQPQQQQQRIPVVITEQIKGPTSTMFEPEPTLVASASTPGGCPSKVVEWSRCLLCNKGFLAMVNNNASGGDENNNREITERLSYLLQHCFEIPPKKTKKTVKKILQEGCEGEEGNHQGHQKQREQKVSTASLFCPTHETMVVEASVLSAKIMKLEEELGKKEEIIRSIVNTWVAGTENQSVEIGAAGLIVKNAILKVQQKKLEQQKTQEESSDSVEVKPSIPEPSASSASTSTQPRRQPKESDRTATEQKSSESSKNDIKQKVSNEGRIRRSPPDSKKSGSQQSTPAVNEKTTATAGNKPSQVPKSHHESWDEELEAHCEAFYGFSRPVNSTRPANENFSSTSRNVITNQPPPLRSAPNTQPPAPRSAPTFHQGASASFQNRTDSVNRNRDGSFRHHSNYSFTETSSSPFSSRMLSSNNFHYSGNFINKECPVPSCPEFFHKAKDRNDHYKIAHSDGIHFACFICKGLYSTFSVLQTHLSHLHDPAKPFPCTQCGKTYGTKERLQAHIQTHVRKTQLQHLNLNPVVRKRLQSSTVSTMRVVPPHRRQNQQQLRRRYLQNNPNGGFERAKNTSSRFPQHSRNSRDYREIISDIDGQSRNGSRVPHSHSEGQYRSASRAPQPHPVPNRRNCHDTIRDVLGHSRNASRVPQPDRNPRANDKTGNVQRKEPEKVHLHECDQCDMDFDSRLELMRHKRRNCGGFAHL